MADFCWQHVPLLTLQSKKVITTIHHIVPDKFNAGAQSDFQQRDRITTAYHVPNHHTKAFIAPLTHKPIHVIPYWANQNIWRPTGEKYELRKKYGIPLNAFVFGSFQRDTEGHDLKSPKLEKGPDVFADLVINAFKEGERDRTEHVIRVTSEGVIPRDHFVVLAGWRRQYVISRLEAAGVPYLYIEKPDQETINELYQTLDLYPVTARHEGGPQSLIECGLLGIKCISRDVGMATAVLSTNAIMNDERWMCQSAVPNVEHLKLPQGYAAYRKLIEEV